MKKEEMGKISFVLSGGGFQGAWIAGILRAFLDARFFPHSVFGDSVGALVGADFVEIATRILNGESTVIAKEIVDIWLQMIKKPSDVYLLNKEEIIWKPLKRALKHKKKNVLKHFPSIFANEFFKAGSLFDNRKVKNLIDTLDIEKIRSSLIEFNIITCDFEISGPKIYSNFFSDTETLKKALLATTAIPAIFEPVEINGSKNNDGARLFPLPIPFADRNKSDTIIAIWTQSKNHEKKKKTPDGWLADLNTSNDILSLILGESQIRRTEKINKDIDAFNQLKTQILDLLRDLDKKREEAEIILEQADFSFKGKKRNHPYILRPNLPLPVTTASCDEEGVKASINLGFEVGQKFLEEINFE